MGKIKLIVDNYTIDDLGLHFFVPSGDIIPNSLLTGADKAITVPLNNVLKDEYDLDENCVAVVTVTDELPDEQNELRVIKYWTPSEINAIIKENGNLYLKIAHDESIPDNQFDFFINGNSADEALQKKLPEFKEMWNQNLHDLAKLPQVVDDFFANIPSSYTEMNHRRIYKYCSSYGGITTNAVNIVFQNLIQDQSVVVKVANVENEMAPDDVINSLETLATLEPYDAQNPDKSTFQKKYDCRTDKLWVAFFRASDNYLLKSSLIDLSAEYNNDYLNYVATKNENCGKENHLFTSYFSFINNLAETQNNTQLTDSDENYKKFIDIWQSNQSDYATLQKRINEFFKSIPDYAHFRYFPFCIALSTLKNRKSATVKIENLLSTDDIIVFSKNYTETIAPDDIIENLTQQVTISQDKGSNHAILDIESSGEKYTAIYIQKKSDNTPFTVMADLNLTKASETFPKYPDYVLKIGSHHVSDSKSAVTFFQNVLNAKHNDFAAICTDDNWNQPDTLKEQVNNYFETHQDKQGKYPYKDKFYYELFCLSRTIFGQQTSDVQALSECLKIDIPELDVKFTLSNFRPRHTKDGVAIMCNVNLSEVPSDLPGFTYFQHYFNDLHPECEIALSLTELKFTFYFKPHHKKTTARIPHPSSNIAKGITVENPKLVLSYSAIFKFGLVEISGDLDFPFSTNWDDGASLQSAPTQNLKLKLSATLDNEEFNIAAELDQKDLFTSPILKGIHFDSIGLEGGIFFEPPGIDFGIAGTFTVGESISSDSKFKMNDDAFGVVFNIEEEIPKPVYLNFYINQLSLETLVTAFTGKDYNIDFPIVINDLTFFYAKKPIALPNGKLSDIGLHLKGDFNLFGYHFYGDFKATMGTGICAQVQADPIDWKIFTLSGGGQEQFIFKDKHGNVVEMKKFPNNSKEKKEQGAKKEEKLKYIKIDKSGTLSQTVNCDLVTKHVLVHAQGPLIHISTDKSPYLSMSLHFDFLGITKKDIEATINKNQISFSTDSSFFGFRNELDVAINYGSDTPHGFSITFAFGFHSSLLGIVINADVSVTLTGTLDNSDNLELTAGIGFDFNSHSLSLSAFTIDVNIKTIDDLLSAIKDKMEEEAEDLLGPLYKAYKDIKKLLKDIKEGLVAIEGAVMNLLKTKPFDRAAKDAAQLMKDVGYAAKEVMKGLKDFYGYEAKEAAKLCKDIDYAADEVGHALEYAYDKTKEEVGDILKGVGYAASEIGHWVSHTWHTVTHPSEW